MTPALAQAVLLAMLAITAGQAQSPVVGKTETAIGTIQDLSGPIASPGQQARNGKQLRLDEINEQGGIPGRKLRPVAEDSGYDPKRAVLAAQKRVSQDKMFIVAGTIGTAPANAAMPGQFEKNVINFLPI
jgi:branched-chain amino acid transport system substrate-binding protein